MASGLVRGDLYKNKNKYYCLVGKCSNYKINMIRINKVSFNEDKVNNNINKVVPTQNITNKSYRL